MKKLLLVPLIVFSVHAYSCTTFLLNKNGNLLFGRNYDWITGAGIVHTNQRGLFKTSSVKNQGEINWVSKFGSITFNQYGKEFPTGGMNEQGLVVELMWLDGTKYPKADVRPAISELQWIQYQLDTHGTVDEIIASDQQIRISERATPLHFLVADAKGNAATIEFLQGKLIVHKNAQLPFPVLTNDTYATSINAAEDALKKGAMTGNNSLDRFVKACKMIKALEAPEAATNLDLKDYAFSILDKVAQGDFTKWSIVYDINRKLIYFKTSGFHSIKMISFPAFNFSCDILPKMFVMNQGGSGDISSVFILPDTKKKQAILETAISESSSHVTISNAEKTLLLDFEKTIQCDAVRTKSQK